MPVHIQPSKTSLCFVYILLDKEEKAPHLYCDSFFPKGQWWIAALFWNRDKIIVSHKKSYDREVGPLRKFPNSLCLSLPHCSQGYSNSINLVRLKGTAFPKHHVQCQEPCMQMARQGDYHQSLQESASKACEVQRESCGPLSVMLNIPKELHSGFKVAQWWSPS